jgi:hypothetical protein
MALTGTQFTTYIKDGYIPQAVETFWRNTFWLNPANHPFKIINGGPGGDTINHILHYSSTSNAAAHAKGNAMPEPDTLNQVRAYFNKDYFEGTAKVYGKDIQDGANGGTEIPVNMQQTAIQDTLTNVEAAFNAAVLTDLAAQVDATTAYSDASLARATYTLASLETAVGGALTLAAMEDTLETLRNTTYGIIGTDDIAILMPPNQLTNLSRLTSFDGSGASFQALNNSGNIDGGRVQLTRTFEGAPIISVPNMTTTEIYFVRISTTELYYHMTPTITEKQLKEWGMSWHIVMGANLIVKDPRRCAKLTGVTA